MKNDVSPGGYVDKARDQMQVYVRRILADNESLRVCLAELETEALGLRQEIRSLQDELTVSRTLQHQLAEKLHDIRGESERRFSEYAKLEAVNANLANLYVASYQLHSTLHREAVLSAIQEIVVNLIGCEEFGIFERDATGRFRLAASVGIDGDESIAAHERVAQATASGETWVSAQHGDLTACVPLKVDGTVTGFIVIRRLLAHKAGLEPLDLELFDLLGTHAAMALYASSLQERFTGRELTA
jgi:nitrate/nitrite-specific signal transduction histidine kinase